MEVGRIELACVHTSTAADTFKTFIIVNNINVHRACLITFHTFSTFIVVDVNICNTNFVCGRHERTYGTKILAPAPADQ